MQRNLQQFKDWNRPKTTYPAVYFARYYARLFKQEHPDVFESYMGHVQSIVDKEH